MRFARTMKGWALTMESDEQRLAEDRALRNAARAVFHTDIVLMRETLDPERLKQRATEKLAKSGESAASLAEDLATNHRSAVAAGLAAIVGLGALVLGRGAIARALSRPKRENDGAPAPALPEDSAPIDENGL